MSKISNQINPYLISLQDGILKKEDVLRKTIQFIINEKKVKEQL